MIGSSITPSFIDSAIATDGSYAYTVVAVDKRETARSRPRRHDRVRPHAAPGPVDPAGVDADAARCRT